MAKGRRCYVHEFDWLTDQEVDRAHFHLDAERISWLVLAWLRAIVWKEQKNHLPHILESSRNAGTRPRNARHPLEILTRAGANSSPDFRSRVNSSPAAPERLAPWKHESPGLRQGIRQLWILDPPLSIGLFVSAGGLEPPTLCLKGRCSTPELRYSRFFRDIYRIPHSLHSQFDYGSWRRNIRQREGPVKRANPRPLGADPTHQHGSRGALVW
jgi:hypothetical protein